MWDEEEKEELGVPEESQLEGYTNISSLGLGSRGKGGTGEEGMDATDISKRIELAMND